MKRICYSKSPGTADILRNHAERYPLMKPQDAVKLLYQSVFGPGHLISDPDMAVRRLKEELAASPSRDSADSDEIGGGFMRMHLTSDTDAEYAAFAFLHSAKYSGSREVFDEKLCVLQDLTAGGAFSFGTRELDSYLTGYRKAGCPMVSHTEEYRQAYAPAYRVVCREFVLLKELIRHIHRLSREQDSVVVTIDGFCASGKSTFAAFLADIFQARLIHMDDFFLPPEKRTAERFAEPGGNVDYERFKAEVVDHLRDDSLTYGVFDCSEMKISSYLTLPKNKVTIIEGAYSHHPVFGRYYDVDAFMETSAEEQRRRILKRDGEEMLSMFESRWIPFEQAYEAAYSVKENCGYLIET